ncbi:MAG TPA: tRNA lysidine(34) synthetase TilS [Chloroflexia bacterium]|nr:tRNA lysidine(34) synthetase TilS [Chloroflexia bacterium]
MSKRKQTNGNALPQKMLEEAQRLGHESLLLRGNLVVGVSGGTDSLALLYALYALRGEEARATLHVAHLEHGFRGEEGKADAAFVAEVATALGLPYTVRFVNVPALVQKYHLSGEEAARRARYGFFATLAHELGATITVAHTANDQAETVLMNMLRGSGLPGIAGMQALGDVRVTPLDDALDSAATLSPVTAQVFRPLLSIWRAEVERYCIEQGLSPRTDSTNTEAIYLRNRIRHDLLPYLQKRYSPAIKEHLHILAEIASGEDSLLESYVGEVWRSIAAHETAADRIVIEARRFGALHVAMQRRIARRAIRTLVGTLEEITFSHITDAIRTLAGVPGSALRLHLPHEVTVERVAGGGIIARRTASESVNRPSDFIERWPVMQPDSELPLGPGDVLALEGSWRVECDTLRADELPGSPGELVAHFDEDTLHELGTLVLRTRRHGDHIQPLGMGGHKSLQDLYVDAKIPRALRDYLPVLALDQRSEVLWVPGPGGRRSAQAALVPETKRVLRVILERDS